MECVKWLLSTNLLDKKELDISSKAWPESADLISNSFAEMIEFLIDNRHLDIHKPIDKHGVYPLHLCVWRPDMVRLLIRRGVAIDAKDASGGTALHRIADVQGSDMQDYISNT